MHTCSARWYCSHEHPEVSSPCVPPPDPRLINASWPTYIVPYSHSKQLNLARGKVQTSIHASFLLTNLAHAESFLVMCTVYTCMLPDTYTRNYVFSHAHINNVLLGLLDNGLLQGEPGKVKEKRTWSQGPKLTTVGKPERNTRQAP